MKLVLPNNVTRKSPDMETKFHQRLITYYHSLFRRRTTTIPPPSYPPSYTPAPLELFLFSWCMTHFKNMRFNVSFQRHTLDLFIYEADSNHSCRTYYVLHERSSFSLCPLELLTFVEQRVGLNFLQKKKILPPNPLDAMFKLFETATLTGSWASRSLQFHRGTLIA